MFSNGQISAAELKQAIEFKLKDLQPIVILDQADGRTSLSVEANRNGHVFNFKSEFTTSRANRQGTPKLSRPEVYQTPKPTTTKSTTRKIWKPPTTKTTTTRSTTTTREPKIYQRDFAQPRVSHTTVRPLPLPFRPNQCGGVIHVDGKGKTANKI